MTRRAIDPFITLTAGILLLMGQSFLLIPQHQGAILGHPTSYTTIPIGFFLFLTGLLALSLIVIPTIVWKAALTQLGMILSLGALAFLYANARLWVEAGMLCGMILLEALSAFREEILSSMTT
jgi:hypothetical protein